MAEECIMLSEIIQAQKSKYFTYVWNLKDQINEQTKQKQIDEMDTFLENIIFQNWKKKKQKTRTDQ